MLTVAILAFGQVEAPSTTGDVQEKVEQLVRKLDARIDRADRVEAEKELIGMGATILPFLPEIDASTSAEKKDRLARIRSELEKGSTVQSADASTITLSGNMSFGEILAEMKKQTGNEVLDFRNRLGQPDENLRLDVDFKDEPFWKAIDSILDQAGLTVYIFSGELRKLALVSKTGGDRDRTGTGDYSGPFRVEATELFAQRNLRNPANEGMRIRLEVLWEPRLAPLLIRQPYENITIIADDGNELASTAPQGTAEIPVQSTVSSVDIVVPIELPDRAATKIKSLTGTFYALVPGQEVQFEFEELEGARGIVKQQSGVTVTLDRITKNRDIYEIRIRVKLSDSSEQMQTHLDWAASNVVQLIANDGRRFEDPNFERYLERENEIGFAYLFPLDDEIKNYKLVYKTPASMIEVPVKYELTDIELP
jgi:hypothetical protein